VVFKNGCQYTADAYTRFAQKYQFQHVRSSLATSLRAKGSGKLKSCGYPSFLPHSTSAGGLHSFRVPDEPGAPKHWAHSNMV